MSAAPATGKGPIDGAYEIRTIEPADPPPDTEGNDWHRYVIGLGDETISGFQRGSRKAVTESVREIVNRLNERRYGKRGRVHLDMSAKGKKPAGK